MRWLAERLRRTADRIDYRGAPKHMSWSFTFEAGRGIVFNQDGRGCPLWYLGDDDYERAHAESQSARAAAEHQEQIRAYIARFDAALAPLTQTCAEAASNFEANLPALRKALRSESPGSR
jgi:hypothetical protein